MAVTDLPDRIVLEFLCKITNEPVILKDLSNEFLMINQIDQSKRGNPFKIVIEKQQSKAGNYFYSYSQNGVPLPDGLDTTIRVEGIIIPMGKVGPSKEKGYPCRSGKAEIVIGGIIYKITAYISKGKMPFYIKVHANKKPDYSQLKDFQQKPKGASFLI